MIRLVAPLLFTLCSFQHHVFSTSIFNVSEVDASIEEDQMRIVGGSPAEVNKYPWFVALRYSSGNLDFSRGCGGMLISEEWVLTAAHCINSRMMNNGAVRIGAYEAPFRHDNNGGQAVEYFRLKSIIKHPDFNSRTENNDFALLHIDGISSITPVPLDSNDLSESYTTGKSDLWIVGLGNTDYYTGDPVTTLTHAEVKYISNIDCTTNYSHENNTITKNMMCAGSDGVDSCQGDSGGPLYDRFNNVLVGIISWGRGCALPEFPGVYARISAQFDWIQGTVCENSSNQPTWCQKENVQSPSAQPSIIPTTAPTAKPTALPSPSPSASPSASPINTPIQSGCVDSPLRFRVYFMGKYRIKHCNWIKTNPGNRCKKYGVKAMCPSTCGTCDSCSDSPVRFKVIINGELKTRSCLWANNWRCQIFSGVAETCRLTCGTCST